MTDKQRNVIARVQRHGLRVICPRCGYQARHFPKNGRLRDQRCAGCGCNQLRSESFAKLHEGRWWQLCSEQRALVAPLAR